MFHVEHSEYSYIFDQISVACGGWPVPTGWIAKRQEAPPQPTAFPLPLLAKTTSFTSALSHPPPPAASPPRNPARIVSAFVAPADKPASAKNDWVWRRPGCRTRRIDRVNPTRAENALRHFRYVRAACRTQNQSGESAPIYPRRTRSGSSSSTKIHSPARAPRQLHPPESLSLLAMRRPSQDRNAASFPEPASQH